MMRARLNCAVTALLQVITGASAGGVAEVSKKYGTIRIKIELKTHGDKII